MYNDNEATLARIGLAVHKEILLLPFGIAIYVGLCWLFGLDPLGGF
jgi:hypothetical protein